ncbi:putative ATP-dependent DNA helicase HFM1 [Sebastes fasciatus]|uniref:putative ATP-dependent DNA helicase HFM1 n=1 Tax=Sebastes fasciatus TaxID=394691 RepID=UPI003D9F4D8F
MLDSDDCTLSLDNLFFERPIVHKVKPLHQEVNPWQLEVPPSLSQLPDTQDMQKEAESLSTLYSFSQRPKTFLPPFKGSAGLKVLSSKVNSPYSYNNDEKEIEETQGGSNNTSTSTSFWGGEGFRDYAQGSHQSGRSGDETPQDSGHVAISRRCLSLDRSKSPPLRRRQVSVVCQDNIYMIVN